MQFAYIRFKITNQKDFDKLVGMISYRGRSLRLPNYHSLSLFITKNGQTFNLILILTTVYYLLAQHKDYKLNQQNFNIPVVHQHIFSSLNYQYAQKRAQPRFSKGCSLSLNRLITTSFFAPLHLYLLRIQSVYVQYEPLYQILSLYVRLEIVCHILFDNIYLVYNARGDQPWEAKLYQSLINLLNLHLYFLLAFCRPLLHDLNYNNLNMLSRKFLHLAKLSISFHKSSMLSINYGFSQQKGDYGIRFDEQKIKKKMQQIKNRKQTVKPKAGQKLQFMNINPQSEVSRRIRKYRQSTNTENLLHFADPSLEQKPTTLQITGFDQTSIQIDNMVYPPAMILFRNQTLIWEVMSIESLTIDDFIILKYVAPKPTYVIVGVNEPKKFPNSILAQLQVKFQNFDVLEMFEATSQYNVTANDDINVMAFLLTK